MDDRVINTLKANQLRSHERRQVLNTIAAAALEFVRKIIWVPRCKKVKSILGTWAAWPTRQQQEAPTAPADGPRQQMPDGQLYVGASGTADSVESANYWGNINKKVFDVNHYLSMVAPSWAY